MFLNSHNQLVCTQHPSAKNEYKMKEVTVTAPDGTIEEYFSCSRCFQVIRITQSLRKDIEKTINGRKAASDTSSAASVGTNAPEKTA